MKYVLCALALCAASACDDGEQESPEVAARKAECRQLEAHIFRISPQSAPQLAGLSETDAQPVVARMVAQLPPEDLEQCAAGEPEVVACMKTATDIAAIKACIPPPKVIGCLHDAKQNVAKRRACLATPPPAT